MSKSGISIPTETIGSIPRPDYLLNAMQQFGAGNLTAAELKATMDKATLETIRRLEEIGSPVITDGEQSKPSFVTYAIDGSKSIVPGGVTIPFADGHTRQLPSASGKFAYTHFASEFLLEAKKLTSCPIKQAVISPSAMALLYPSSGIPNYTRDQFIADVIDQSVLDIRKCLDGGASSVQIDCTELRLALKLDPSGSVLREFVDLINKVLEKFTPAQRALIGIHTCPGADQDATHSLDVDYAELIPTLFKINAGRFYMELAAEIDRERVLSIISSHLRENCKVFLGVIDVNDPRVETPEEVRDRVLEIARHIPVDRFGTCDDCGFSPFADDKSTSRETAFAKIRARIQGTKLACDMLGL
ncbi:hypothetical protein PPL_03891 [Heterostelium album PN500]|uniref:Cobalamin-independent methionine synthase MetE C-terminal/archaeal domain-containing protein n=1 Tax=Heterostelium pallidum (strain ATCC 26659 / Pp 5 / PN500) TaxID=670386 RepID=D3B5F3_HETP5|nr:hypothetical protein PPL_03891 [Heterostelium album PN500]EFA83101.1 hypothetical protein PPL_03891 [Heterostelium album PN500]|eukprot:XP_020435218.1 hypothetical protein PPL_03891 [Heterostelium album PN500]